MVRCSCSETRLTLGRSCVASPLELMIIPVLGRCLIIKTEGRFFWIWIGKAFMGTLFVPTMIDRFFVSLSSVFVAWMLFFTGSLFAQSNAGGLDISFNGTGIWTDTIHAQESGGTDSVILPDGKIIVVGCLYHSSGKLDALVQRHLSDGSIDTSFGTQGRLVLPTSAADRMFSRVILQPDGKILAAGWSRVGYKPDVLALRLLPDGSFDGSFGVNGLATVSLGAGQMIVTDVDLQPDGKILVTGWGDHPTTGNRLVGACRLTASGQLDTGFAINGAALYHYGVYNEVQDMVLLPDGRMVFAGMLYRDSQQIGMVVCLNGDGTRDTRVSVDGAVYTSFGPGISAAFTRLILLPDDRLLALGSKHMNGRTQLMLARYSGDIELDSTFGSEGFATPSFGQTGNTVADAALTDRGQLLIASSNFTDDANGGIGRFALIRLQPDGSPDEGFGVDGQIVTPIGIWATPASLVEVASNRWLVTGDSIGESNQVTLVRYLTGPATVTVRNEDGVIIDSGNKLVFKAVAQGFTSQHVLEVTHPGGEDLPDVGLQIEGAGFSISPSASAVPQGKTSYAVRFQPAGIPGLHTGVLKVTRSSSQTPLLEIQLEGKLLSATEDTDGDGLNDVTEFKLESFGFDPLIPQAEKVNLLFGSLGEAGANLNAGGYYTANQIQDLHAGSLLERDNESGEMILRLHLEQSSDLAGFELMPLTESGISLTPEGRLEYRFLPAQGRAFYRLTRP